jgi:putative endonuclease
MLQKHPAVYILANGRAATTYIGVKSNLPARLHQHRSGLIEGFTSRYGVTRRVWFEMHEMMASAITREKQLKKWNRDWKLNLIEAANPEWVDLAIGLGFEPLTDAPNGSPPSRG